MRKRFFWVVDTLDTPSFHSHEKLFDKARFKSWSNNVKKSTSVVVAKKAILKVNNLFFLLEVEKAYHQEFMPQGSWDMKRCFINGWLFKVKTQIGFLQMSGKSAEKDKEKIQNPDDHTLLILFN